MSFVKGRVPNPPVLKLYAPSSYWETPSHIIDEMTGGCGPGGFGDMLVPDTMYGLSVKPACRIHDFQYFVGKTLEDKIAADRIFLNNMVRIINANSGLRILRRLRLIRARTYYTFVQCFGGPAFWAGKNSNLEEREHG